MNETQYANLSFEKAARNDFRIWIAFLVGCILSLFGIANLFDSTFFKVEDGPVWMNWMFSLAGLGMASVSALCLVFNTSRGCLVDEESQELVWWQMKFSHQETRTKSRIKLCEIGTLRIDRSNDGVELSLLSTDGQKQGSFSEFVLPPDYEKWCEDLASKWPQITIEKV